MRYLLGDSTESDLEFNYLAFLREVVDCAVVLLEAEATLTANVERRNVRATESVVMIRAVEELGRDATAVVEPILKQDPKTPAGKCAAVIAKAIKDAVEAETTQVKSALTTLREEIDRDDLQVRAKARAVLEKLLRAHDLPDPEKVLEAAWSGGTVTARLRERTKFGVEAVISLDTKGSAVLVPDLRVDRIAENVEVHVNEAGGWLKKSEKLVAQKLGRYQVVGVRTDAGGVAIQLRSAPDASATTLAVTLPKKGEIAIEGSAAGKEYTLEERDRAGLKLVADKLDAALRELSDRTALADLLLDGKPFTEHAHPRVMAERLIAAVAPNVQMISKHSRSPGELVLRRQIAGDRREEVFVPISELVKRIETLPVASRLAFAPLQLDAPAGSGPVAIAAAPTQPTDPVTLVFTPPPELKKPTIPPPVVPPPSPRARQTLPPPPPPPPAPAARGVERSSTDVDEANLGAAIDKALAEEGD